MGNMEEGRLLFSHIPGRGLIGISGNCDAGTYFHIFSNNNFAHLRDDMR